MFYICFSLLSLPVWALDFFSLSLLPSNPSFPQQLNRERTNDTPIQGEADHLHGRATPIGSSPSSSPSETRATWASHSGRIIAIVIAVGGTSGMGKPLRSSTSSSPLSSPSSSPFRSCRSLSVSLGGWLFWLLLVGWFWLMVVGWSGCGCEIWVDIGVWVWVDRVGWFWCLSEFLFFFFLVAVADIGGWWLICGGGQWL